MILNMNGIEVLRGCLRSAERMDYPNWKAVVVDNGSTDGSQEMVKKEFPRVHLIENGKNLGVAEGQNIGIRHALSDGAGYVFVLNNDLVLDSATVSELAKACSSDPSIGIAGPVLYSAAHREELQSAGGMLNRGRAETYHLTAFPAAATQGPYDVDYIGLVFASRKAIEKIGLFCTPFFAYWEDVEICARARLAGYRVVSVPTSKVWHEGSFTTKRMSSFFKYYTTRNKFLFMRKHADTRSYLSSLLFFLVWRFPEEHFIYLFRKGDLKVLKAVYRGALHGIIGEQLC